CSPSRAGRARRCFARDPGGCNSARGGLLVNPSTVSPEFVRGLAAEACSRRIINVAGLAEALTPGGCVHRREGVFIRIELPDYGAAEACHKGSRLNRWLQPHIPL